MNRFCRNRWSCVVVRFYHCTLYTPQVAEAFRGNETCHLAAQHPHLTKKVAVYEGDLVVNVVEHSEGTALPRPQSHVGDTGDE